MFVPVAVTTRKRLITQSMKNLMHKIIHKNHHRDFDFSSLHHQILIRIGKFLHCSYSKYPFPERPCIRFSYKPFYNYFSNSGNSSKVENTSNVHQQQNNNPSSSQPPNTTTMSRQSNGIWKTVDKAAMNRVGQRYPNYIL